MIAIIQPNIMMRRHATECMASLIRKTLSLSGCQEATIFFHDAAKAVLPPLSKLGHLPTRSVVTPVPSSKVDLRPLVLPTIFSHIIDRFKVNGSFLSHPIRGGIGAFIKYPLRVLDHYVTSLSYIQSWPCQTSHILKILTDIIKMHLVLFFNNTKIYTTTDLL